MWIAGLHEICADQRFPDIFNAPVQSDRISIRKFQIFIRHDREIHVDQEKVGGNELPDTEEMVNPVSVLRPELCQKRDGVA